MSYVETGRLNRSVIEKDIAISWYKCKLQNMHPDDPLKKNNDKAARTFEDRFMRFIDSIIPVSYQYVLSNKQMQKCSFRTEDQLLNDINQIDDLFIGTNAGYISLKSGMVHGLSLHEHYLNAMSIYYEVAVPIHEDDQCVGVISLFSQNKINEYDVNRIVESLKVYNRNENLAIATISEIDSVDMINELGSLFVLTKDAFENLKKQVDKAIASRMPIMIIGDRGTGRTTLALYLSIQKHKIPCLINYSEIHKSYQKQYTESMLSQNDTIIFDNIEHANRETIALLTVYTDYILDTNRRIETSKYRCLNMIMTTVNRDINSSVNYPNSKQVRTLIDKLKFMTVNLVNTGVFQDDINMMCHKFLEKNELTCADSEWFKYKRICNRNSFKEIQASIDNATIDDENRCILRFNSADQNHLDQIMSLDENEKKHIIKVYNDYDKNMTATAEILKIGRSTLYRKMQKYQIETKD